MSETNYRNRRAVQIENANFRVTVTQEGCHIAEILHKESGVNPLWTPPWPSIEPSAYDPAKHPGYGGDAESKLLAGIMGHNVCIDLFGGPSAEEAAAGMTVHGEASIAPYKIAATAGELHASAELPLCQLHFERILRVADHSNVVRITETVENRAVLDRPIAWTEHATLGPPFLEKGATQIRMPATRSKVFDGDFGEHARMPAGAEFHWPNAPLVSGGTEDLRVFTNLKSSGGFTTQLMDPHREQAFFAAWSPASGVLFGYVWKRSDFPWLGMWEENFERTTPPWNGKSLTCGMEFGASPMAESRRQMIDRGSLFGVPGYRWIPALTKVQVNYCAFITKAAAIPEDVIWNGGDAVRFA